jgi:hypothetical protein
MLGDRHIIRFNQWQFAATVLMATLLVRFLTSSWTISLIVSAMLLSRGRLLAELGHISVDGSVMLLVTAWFASMAHYLRTGATASLVAAVLTALAGALFDEALIALALGAPLMLLGGFLLRKRLAKPVLQRLRGLSRRMRHFGPGDTALQPDEAESFVGRVSGTVRWMLGLEFPPHENRHRWPGRHEKGGLFRTIEVPFALWVYGKRRWLKLLGIWLAAALVGAALALGAHQLLASLTEASGLPPLLDLMGGGASADFGAWHRSWLVAFARRFDLHLTLSTAVIITCALQSPAAGLTSFFEGVILVLITCSVLIVGAYLADFADWSLLQSLKREDLEAGVLGALRTRPVAVWIEPVILSLGVAGVYNLMKVLDTRIAERS